MYVVCTQKWWNSEGFLGEMDLLISYSVGTCLCVCVYICACACMQICVCIHTLKSYYTAIHFLIVTGPAKIDHVTANYTELYFH